MTRDPIDPAAGGKLALSGRLVTMDEHFTVIDDGVIYIDAGRIVAAQAASADAPAGFEQAHAVAVQGTIYPGLIELHNCCSPGSVGSGF